MFQRLSNLLFGEVEEVAAELKGPKPCVTEADEEGWMLVNLPDQSGCIMAAEDETQAQISAHPLKDSNQPNHENTLTRTECQTSIPRPPNKRCRTRKSQPQGAVVLSDPPSCPRRVRMAKASSTQSLPPDEGATAEASPMEDLLIEHPSMSVYVSPSNLSIVSNGNLSVVDEESIMSMASSVSRVAEPAAAPATHTAGPFRVTFGPYVQPKVAQVARVQRGKARIERRHLSRNRIHRQNRTREQVPRHASHARNTFLHQPSKRNFCH
uniref:tumor protein p53-inducible nuclear protein 2 isoform X2 n=1 Tax=Doryrhamphus excisus TaxID=161450 RepID=UPI0025AE765D|nr:tumor protein p53-inducible nuclear protein 2 isoform X2 [Doryrhamphus excisus]